MMLAAEDAETAVMGLGPAGPVQRTVMLDNVAIVGVRAAKTLPRLHIHYIWISPSVRGKGHGSAALRRVLTIADQYDVELQLRPACFDRSHFGVRTGLDTRSLTAWYARNGFAPASKHGTRSHNHLLRPRRSVRLSEPPALGLIGRICP